MMVQTASTPVATLPVSTLARAVPSRAAARTLLAGLQAVTLTVQCTTGAASAAAFTGFAAPFNDPALTLQFGVEWSWDGGSTWPMATHGTQQGSATGTWGTDKATGKPVTSPVVSLGVPAIGGVPPTHYRAFVVAGAGPVSCGLGVGEATG